MGQHMHRHPNPILRKPDGEIFAAGDKQMMARAMACIEDMFDTVEARLADGRALLGGNKLSVDDIMFASHAAFVLFPPEFGAGSCTRWPPH